MNEEQLARLNREFDRLRPILCSDLKLVVTDNYIYWFANDHPGECCFVGEQPIQDDRIADYDEYYDGDDLFKAGKRILGELQNSFLDIKDVAKLGTGVKLLWYDSYWDGPLSGTCEWNGKKYYFLNIDPELREYHYTMREMDQAEWDARSQDHLLFQQYVGNHTDYHYDADGKRLPRCSRDYAKPASEREKYLAARVPIPISNNPVSAWFDKY